MLRADFLRRMVLTTAGLFVADDALEMLAQSRKYWRGWNAPIEREAFIVGPRKVGSYSRTLQRKTVTLVSDDGGKTWPTEEGWKVVCVFDPKYIQRPIGNYRMAAGTFGSGYLPDA